MLVILIVSTIANQIPHVYALYNVYYASLSLALYTGHLR